MTQSEVLAQNQESIDRQKIGTHIIRKVVLQETSYLFLGKKLLEDY